MTKGSVDKFFAFLCSYKQSISTKQGKKISY